MQTLHQKETQEMLFTDSLDTHIKLVRLASRTLNDYTDINETISLVEMQTHDASKFGPNEFPYYARHLFGDKEDIHGWESALMHHYKNNKHHPQYWLNDFNKLHTESKCVPNQMPPMQYTVMLADWLSAGRQYQGNWDITNWLNDNLMSGKIILHESTFNELAHLLDRIGYTTNSYTGKLKLHLTNTSFTEKLKDGETYL